MYTCVLNVMGLNLITILDASFNRNQSHPYSHLIFVPTVSYLTTISFLVLPSC